MYIPPFRTHRIDATFRPLTMRNLIALAELPQSMNEMGIGRLISYIVEDSNIPPVNWTIEERYAALIHYQVAENQGDITIDENSSYLSYLHDTEKNAVEYLFDFDGEPLKCVPCTAEYIEAVEALVSSGEVQRLHSAGAWDIAMMAAMIQHQEEKDEGVVLELVQARVNQILDLTYDDFEALYAQYLQGRLVTSSIVQWGVDKDGIYLNTKIEEEGADFQSARFPFSSVIPDAIAAIRE